MLDYGHAILKGLIQGLTEFLPVSSTAHLIFTDAFAHIFGDATTLPGEEEFFDIMLHLGTLAAVLWYFRQEVFAMVQAMLGKPVNDITDWDHATLDLKKVPWYLVLSSAVTVVWILSVLKGSEIVMAKMNLTGPHIEDLSDYFLAHPAWVGFHLIVTGCLLFFTEIFSAKRESVSEPLSNKHAMIIGFFQGCAGIFHGISRSGSTISAGLLSGLNRLTATRYSFLLSIPTFIMAAVYESLKVMRLGIVEHLNWPAMAVGTVVAGVVGYFCVKYFIAFVAKHSLRPFAIYCWVVGASLMIYFLSGS